MFHLVTACIGAFVVWRFILQLPLGRAARRGLGLAVMLLSQYHLITRTFFGTLASPELPRSLLILSGGLFSALILLAALVLLRDVGLVLWRVAAAVFPSLIRLSAGGQSRLNAALLAAVAVLAPVGVWQAVRVPSVHTVEIVLPRLPAALDGTRVVQLSDLHASRLLPAAWIEAVVERANSLKPDLILITGDLVDGTPALRSLDVAPLRALTARLGVFAIPGNHEYYASYPEWLSAFAGLGLPMLLNSHVLVRDKGHALVIAGTTDRAAERIGEAMPDIRAALAGAPADAVRLLLAHQPRGAEKNAAAGVDLQLSGHTHGGQVLGLHFITGFANDGLVSGVYRIGEMQLNVSNGTGLWNGFPVRLGRPAEITEIVLRAP